MKTMMTWLLGLAMALLSGMAFANAKVHSMTGTVSAAVGPAPARAVKAGDTIPAGQTVITAANSTVVLQFPDGHLAALTPNTRMTIEQYQYNEQAKSGNLLLNLISGGMRAITGLIGRSSPEKVSYKAATATIGIRGTDTTIVIAGQTVTVSVSNGAVTFRIGAQSVVIPAGSGVLTSTVVGAVQTITVQSTQAILDAVRAQPGGAAIEAVLAQATSGQLQAAITSAATVNTGTVSTTPVGGNPDSGTTTVITPNPPSG